MVPSATRVPSRWPAHAYQMYSHCGGRCASITVCPAPHSLPSSPQTRTLLCLSNPPASLASEPTGLVHQGLRWEIWGERVREGERKYLALPPVPEPGPRPGCPPRGFLRDLGLGNEMLA